MKAFTKLREKFFPKSEVEISAVFSEDEKSNTPAHPPAVEKLHSGASKGESDLESIELTPELRDALFPKTRMMISATFNVSKPAEIPPVAPREKRDPDIGGEREFPIL